MLAAAVVAAVAVAGGIWLGMPAGRQMSSASESGEVSGIRPDVAQEPAPAAESVLAMYRTQPDERLWDVMKRYRLPRESLLALNEQLTADEEETLPEGTCVIAYKR